MPVYHRSNNRVVPANQRAVDVARQALTDLTPVEQRRYHNAFLVSGYECQVYSVLKQGQPCSCQSQGKTLATLLDEHGKMPTAKQNELLTGMKFSVNLYGNSDAPREDMRKSLGVVPESPTRPGFPNEGPKTRKHQTVFEVLDTTGQNAHATTVTTVEDPDFDFGSNGPQHSIDDHFADFDAGNLTGLGDSACGVCFGKGYVNGYSLLGGWRQLFSTQWKDKDVTGTVEVNTLPHSFFAESVTFRTILPRGFRDLDRIGVWNNTQLVPNAILKIDGQVLDYPTLTSKFDGRFHDITVQFSELTTWTHLEIQVDLGNEARLEFPRLTKGFDASKLDGLESIQLNVSPIVPHIDLRDVITETTFGKAFLVTSAQLWNTRQRNVLGWDCQARVVQPNELSNLLPRRRPTIGQKATKLVRDNQDGRRRT